MASSQCTRLVYSYTLEGKAASHQQNLKGHSHDILVQFKSQKYVLISMDAPK